MSAPSLIRPPAEHIVISDTDPQPLLVRSKLGIYSICSVGIIRNAEQLSTELLESGCANFETMSSGSINSGSLIGALIAQKDNFTEGIRVYRQSAFFRQADPKNERQVKTTCRNVKKM